MHHLTTVRIVSKTITSFSFICGRHNNKSPIPFFRDRSWSIGGQHSANNKIKRKLKKSSFFVLIVLQIRSQFCWHIDNLLCYILNLHPSKRHLYFPYCFVFGGTETTLTVCFCKKCCFHSNRSRSNVFVLIWLLINILKTLVHSRKVLICQYFHNHYFLTFFI